MGQKLVELEDDRDLGRPGAQERLESFREQRTLLVNSITQVGFHSAISSCRMMFMKQSCTEFEKWTKAEAVAQTSDARERRTQRRKA